MANEIQCKYCQSENVIKYGKYKGVQYYYCKDCRRKFANPDTIPKMQYPTSQVADVLNMYYEGMSLQEIRRNLIQQHSSYISDVTALNWVNRFSKPAIIEATIGIGKTRGFLYWLNRLLGTSTSKPAMA